MTPYLMISAVMMSSQFSSATSGQEGQWIKEGPGGRVIDILNAPYPSFQEKMEKSIEKATGLSGVNARSASSPQGYYGSVELYLRGGFDGQYRLTSPITVDLYRKNSFNITCDKAAMIDYSGSSGAAFTFKHARGMVIKNLSIRLQKDNTMGIRFRHNAKENHLYQCVVEMPRSRRNSAGIVFQGDVEPGRGGGDIAFNDLEKCTVYSQTLEDKIDKDFTGDHLGVYANENNIGFILIGGDLMANSQNMCKTARLKVGFTQDVGDNSLPLEGTYSGNGLTTYRDCSSDYCYVGWHLPGQGVYNFFGGRSENTGCYVLFGAKGGPSTYVDQNGSLGLFGVEFSGTRSPSGVTSPMYVHNSMIDVRTSGSVVATNCVFSHSTMPVPTDVFRLASSKTSTGRAFCSITGCRQIGGAKSPALPWESTPYWQVDGPTGWVVGRQWTVFVDGVKRSL